MVKLPVPKAMQYMVLYGISIVLMKGVSLFMLPFITHQLPPDEFGRLEVLTSIAMFASIILGMGLSEALYRFAGAAQNEQAQKFHASQVMGITLCIAILTLPFVWTAAALIGDLSPALFSRYELSLMFTVLAFESCIAVPLAWLRMRDKVWTFFLLTTGRAISHAGLILLMLHAGKGVTGILEAGFMVAMTQAVLLLIIQYRDTGIRIQRVKGREILSYSWPIMGSGLLAFTLNGFDRWVLAHFASLQDVAQYAVASKFALAVVLMMQPFGMWWMPKRFGILFGENGRYQAARMTTHGLALLGLITVSVNLVAPVFIHWLMPASYAQASLYAFVLILIAALREICELLNLGALATKSTRSLMMIQGLSAVVGVCLMILLTPAWSVWGILAALLAAQFIRVLLIWRLSQARHPLPFRRKALAAGAALTAIVMSLSVISWNAITQILVAGVATLMLAWCFHHLQLLPDFIRHRVLSR
ncbi:oligosaccharide flippase family protein [Photobacterium sp. CCB-ST2H9]|uniref:lipopolysaccharide biosynthesis protein n=1 Tax=Photobacterium sp. CCB-ST2H9 TaxID=2912855 RepID=UPI002006C28C|nr:oligosaccharide flippase family protein [Photobacterium sp. CCB-ST2H9]UTM55983.1 oligosaccharide flippase family protein [Photobacterium sp. CCB-ST2H9]